MGKIKRSTDMRKSQNTDWKQKNQTEHYLKAYMTVEAALVVPIALFCILFVCYLAIFQYDRCLLSQDTKILMLRASNRGYETNQELFNSLWEEELYLGRKKYPYFTWYDKSLQVSLNEVKFTGMGKLSTYFAGLLYSAPSTKIWDIQIEEAISKYEPATFVRKAKRVELVLEVK